MLKISRGVEIADWQIELTVIRELSLSGAQTVWPHQHCDVQSTALSHFR